MLEASSGYWQTKFKDADKDMTALVLLHDLHRFICMPSG